MPFIGTQPDVGGYSVLDSLTASATASYTLQKDSANFSPSSANQLLVSLNGVIQKPGSSFTVSGSTLTFSSALSSSDSIDFILAMGEPLLVGTPSDATITGSKLASNIGISTTGNIATTGSGTLSVAGNTTLSGTAAITGLITASAGVAIGGTGSANTLDDYEEGTFTPALSGPSSVTFNTQFGEYTKVGRTVFAHFHLNIASVSGGSNYRVLGWPFTPKGATSNIYGGVLRRQSALTSADAGKYIDFYNASLNLYYYSRTGSAYSSASHWQAGITTGVAIYDVD